MTAVVYPDNVSRNKQSVDAQKMINQKAHRMTFEMDKAMHSKLKMASASEGVYMKDIFNQAIKEWLSKRGYM